MATELPPLPKPPDKNVPRVNAKGLPTPEVITYETQLRVFLTAVKLWIESQ